LRLAVDARLMVGHPRGMGQYARAILEPVKENVIALLPKNQATNDWHCFSKGLSFFPLWEQVTLPKMVLKLKSEALFCPANTAPISEIKSTKKIVVIHDLIYLQNLSSLPLSASTYQNLGRLYRRIVVPNVIKTADVILTVSEYTRNSIVERFGVPEKKIFVIPNGLNESWFGIEPLIESKRSPYILAVSGEAPSKNLRMLLSVFSQLIEENAVENLVLRVVGISPKFRNRFEKQIEEGKLRNRVVFEHFLSQADLQNLYRYAKLFVMPSLYEGFGIPLIEAMACGTPIASSGTTSMPEVLGGNGWLFDPRDLKDMKNTILEALVDKDAREKKIEKAYDHVTRYRLSKVQNESKEFWDFVL